MRRERGYTLLEVLVALVLFSVLLLMVAAFNQAVRQASRSGERSDVLELGLGLIPQLRADLQRSVAIPSSAYDFEAGPRTLLVRLGGDPEATVAYLIEEDGLVRGRVTRDGLVDVEEYPLEQPFRAWFHLEHFGRRSGLLQFEVVALDGTQLASFHHRAPMRWGR